MPTVPSLYKVSSGLSLSQGTWLGLGAGASPEAAQAGLDQPLEKAGLVVKGTGPGIPPSCVLSSGSLKFPEPCFSPLGNDGSSGYYGGLNELMSIERLAEYLAHSRYSGYCGQG